MIRRFVDWILHILHIKRREPKSALEAILELIPYLLACMVVRFIVNKLDLPSPTLWQRVLFGLRLRLRHWRMVVIGH